MKDAQKFLKRSDKEVFQGSIADELASIDLNTVSLVSLNNLRSKATMKPDKPQEKNIYVMAWACSYLISQHIQAAVVLNMQRTLSRSRKLKK